MEKTSDLEICPICSKPYGHENIKVQYHLQYNPKPKFIYACRACNYAEYLSRHWSRHIKPWQWWRIFRVRAYKKMLSEKEIIVRCRGIIIHENKLLVVKHHKNDNYTALPGGHLEWGEDIESCLKRELTEEMGVVPELGRLLYVYTFIDKNSRQSIEFFFEVRNGADFLHPNPKAPLANELAEIIWAQKEDELSILPEQIQKDLNTGKILENSARFISSLN